MPDQPNVSPVRGMRDLLPAECELRDWAVGRILDVYRRFGFARIETPVLEHLALLTGGQGGENEKLIFKIAKRGDELAEELEALVARYLAIPGALDEAESSQFAELRKALSASSGEPDLHATTALADFSKAFGVKLREIRNKVVHAGVERNVRLAWSHFLDEDQLFDFGLRFDLTVPLARYYASNQASLSQPFKAIQIGSVFRAERPQKGRFRQFTQCDIDVLGEPGEIAEVELILATTEALGALGLSDFTVRLNDRLLLRAIAQALGISDEDHQERFFVTLDKLDKIGRSGVVEEMRTSGFAGSVLQGVADLFDAFEVSSNRPALEGLDAWRLALGAKLWHESGQADATTPRLVEARFDLLTGIARSAQALLGDDARIAFDPTLVRGMGYYTGPIFEISMEGAPGSIAGGGRYDKMIGRMLGREVPACGFSIGFERVIGLLMERGSKPPKAGTRFALLHEPGVDSLQRVMAEASAKRAAVEGNSVAVFAKRKKFGKQLDELEKAGFDCVLTLPEGNGPPEEKWLGAR